MTTVAAIAIVMSVVQFAKKLLPTVVQGAVGEALVVVVSIGVTAYSYISTGKPLDFGAITFLIAVIVGSMSAYALLKVAGGSAEKGGSATTNVPPVK